MAKATSPPAREKRYFISFTVRDGDNEYGNDTILDCDHEPSDQECVEHVIREYCWGATDKETEEIVQEAKELYAEDGYFEESPGYRHFSDIYLQKDEDDVRLQDAAPEMLKALEAIRNDCNDWLDSKFDTDAPTLFAAIRNAAAKAIDEARH